MLLKKLQLINEQTSPLFRIMWIHNINEPARKTFDNNVSAFHIGNGIVLSVAHNLRTECGILISVDNAIYLAEIFPHITPDQAAVFELNYPLDPTTNKRYFSNNNAIVPRIIDILKHANFDTRWVTLTSKNICNPYLIIQFNNNQFYNNAALMQHFDPRTYFHEPSIGRHTFLLEVELINAHYSKDIAVYRINMPTEIINSIPSIQPSYDVLDESQDNFHCIQSSPNSNVGAILNKALIDGLANQHSVFNDNVGGNYFFEGLRYLIKGYFRFGSSGAPYVHYDAESDSFKVNAIQSQACPIQLSINNSMNGNFQYISAIASPLNDLRDELQELLAA